MTALSSRRARTGARHGLARTAIVAAVLAVAACQSAPPPETTQAAAQAAPEGPTAPVPSPSTSPATAPEPRRAFAPGPETAAETHMIVAAHPLAAEAGRDALRQGGSAVDAVLAAQMVLGVVEPQSSGIGGGGFLLHYSARTGDVDAYDGRETAPAAATEDMFLNPDGSPREFFDVAVSGLSVGTPGLLRMAELVHFRHGRLDWPALFAPAIRVAENGFEISPRLHALVARDRYLADSRAAGYFLDAEGNAKAAGTRLANPVLADTLRHVAKRGAQAFYEGEIADDIVAAARGDDRSPGRLTKADLANYRAKQRDAVCSLYRQWVVCGMGPPSSGGVGVLQILGILQRFDLGAVAPGSAEAAHLLAEAGRLAYADRATYLADSDVEEVPVTRLIDPGYLARRSRLIDPGKAMSRALPGNFGGRSARLGAAPEKVGVSTTHISAVDGDGNVAVLTSSIENAFGSRIMVRGFLLNNQLTDFSFLPKRGGKVIANRVGPGKRPRSTMSPTIVLDGAGKPTLAAGSPGGARIIAYVAQTIIGVLDWGLGPQAAVELPHVVNLNGPTLLEADTDAADLAGPLAAMGHEVRLRPMTSGLNIIGILPEGFKGGADPRREGVALGD